MFDRRTALVSAVLMAFMGWHILFSRTAFMVTARPLVEVIFLGTLFSAYKRQSYVLSALAGVVLGIGVYTYNAYPVFVGATGVFAVVLLPLSIAVFSAAERWAKKTGRLKRQG